MLNNAKIILKDGTKLAENNPRTLCSILKAQLHTYEKPKTKQRDIVSGPEFLAMLGITML